MQTFHIDLLPIGLRFDPDILSVLSDLGFYGKENGINAEELRRIVTLGIAAFGSSNAHDLRPNEWKGLPRPESSAARSTD